MIQSVCDMNIVKVERALGALHTVAPCSVLFTNCSDSSVRGDRINTSKPLSSTVMFPFLRKLAVHSHIIHICSAQLCRTCLVFQKFGGHGVFSLFSSLSLQPRGMKHRVDWEIQTLCLRKSGHWLS